MNVIIVLLPRIFKIADILFSVEIYIVKIVLIHIHTTNKNYNKKINVKIVLYIQVNYSNAIILFHAINIIVQLVLINIIIKIIKLCCNKIRVVSVIKNANIYGIAVSQ